MTAAGRWWCLESVLQRLVVVVDEIRHNLGRFKNAVFSQSQSIV